MGRQDLTESALSSRQATQVEEKGPRLKVIGLFKKDPFKRLKLPDIKDIDQGLSDFVAFSGMKVFGAGGESVSARATEPISRGVVTPYGVTDYNKNVLLAGRHAQSALSL